MIMNREMVSCIYHARRSTVRIQKHSSNFLWSWLLYLAIGTLYTGCHFAHVVHHSDPTTHTSTPIVGRGKLMTRLPSPAQSSCLAEQCTQQYQTQSYTCTAEAPSCGTHQACPHWSQTCIQHSPGQYRCCQANNLY
ncbi:MAG: hypothetical protein AAGJ35_06635 [Myxococcota bacterium]